MKRLLIRSPIVLMVVPVFLVILFIGTSEEWPFLIIPVALYFIWFIVTFLATSKHNKHNPNDQIKLWTLTPYELREQDEGMRYYTNLATRKVYIFYYWAIPIAMVLVFLFENQIKYFTLLLLCLMYVMHLLIYWTEIRKLELED